MLHFLKFDKTTTQQINKQYDSFFSYCSCRFQRIVTILLLVSHFFEFKKKLEIHGDFLLSSSMNSLTVNKFFEKKTAKRISESYSTKFLDVGSCPLHSVDNTFLEELKELKNINLDQFVLDMHFSLNILHHVDKIMKVLQTFIISSTSCNLLLFSLW